MIGERFLTLCFFIKLLVKLLEFGRTYENKTFYVCFVFLKEENNLDNFEIFFKFFRNVLEKTEYFNTESLSYSINIEPDIMQNY
jgi:hypothetical protein